MFSSTTAAAAGFACLAALSAQVRAYPGSFGNGNDLSKIKPGANFGLMGGIPTYAAGTSDVCEITSDIPAVGFTAGKAYTFKISTSNAAGLGMVWDVGGTKGNSGTPGRGKETEVAWTATGDSVSAYAICGAGGGFGVHVAASVTAKKAVPGATPAPTTPAPPTTAAAPCRTFTGYVMDRLCTNRRTNEDDFLAPVPLTDGKKTVDPLKNPEEHTVKCLLYGQCTPSSFDILSAEPDAKTGLHTVALRVIQDSALHKQITALLRTKAAAAADTKGLRLTVVAEVAGKAAAEDCTVSFCTKAANKVADSTKLGYEVYQAGEGSVTEASTPSAATEAAGPCPAAPTTTTKAIPTTTAPTQDGAPDVAKLCTKDTKDYTYVAVGDFSKTKTLFCSQYDKDKETYTFLMSLGKGQAWAAVGTSSNGKMPGGKVMIIGLEAGKAHIKYYTNDGNSGSTRDPTGQPEDAECFNDATQGLVCKWTRKADAAFPATGTGGTKIIWAFGTGAFAAGPSFHTDRGDLQVNMAAAGATSKAGAITGLATKGNLAHGALMILAWLVFSPIGTAMARYGKHLEKIWFKPHMYLQIMAVAFTVIAAIIISQVIGDTKSFETLTECKGDVCHPSKDHVEAGLCVCVFAVVQVLLGLLRNVISGGPHSDKHPHGPRRVIFNWLHRLNGYLLFGLATYTVYKGVTVFTVGSTKADASGTVFYQWLQEPAEELIFAFVGVSLGFGLIMELARIPAWTMEGWQGRWGLVVVDGAGEPTEGWEMKLRSILVAVYIAFVVATGIAMLVIIGDTETFGRANED